VGRNRKQAESGLFEVEVGFFVGLIPLFWEREY